MNDYHITQNEDGSWSVTRNGALRPTRIFNTQIEAIEYVRQLQSERSVKIHGRDGKIREERTYPRSADPYPPRG